MAQRPKAKPKSKGRKDTGVDDKAQSARFVETARKLGISDDREPFERAIKSIVAPKKPT
jgi:hypothetical protein